MHSCIGDSAYKQAWINYAGYNKSSGLLMGKLSDRRMARITSLLKQALSEIILNELKDPRLGIFSITDIRLSRDMS